MPKYKKRPVVIEAVQWNKMGDHPDVFEHLFAANPQCSQCGHRMAEHGTILTLEGRHIVCPGDFVITGVKGEHYPCKPDIFAETYEQVKEG